MEPKKQYDSGSYRQTKNKGTRKEPKNNMFNQSPLTFAVNEEEEDDDGSYKEEKKPKKSESTTHYIPVIKNGVPVETKEVQEARLQHLTAHVRALERIKTIEGNVSKQKKEEEITNRNNDSKPPLKEPKSKEHKKYKEDKKQSTNSFLKTVCITMHICSSK